VEGVVLWETQVLWEKLVLSKKPVPWEAMVCVEDAGRVEGDFHAVNGSQD
jgi:hypothetical protein